jgi:hypothetical protein
MPYFRAPTIGKLSSVLVELRVTKGNETTMMVYAESAKVDI